MEKNKGSTFFMVMCLFLYKARSGHSAKNVDHKCSNGLQISVFWWSQEPYIFTPEQHGHEEDHNEQPDEKEIRITGMLPTVLSKVLHHCCHKNTTLNYTKISDGPASLDELLAKEYFDVIVPVGSQVGAETVRGSAFVGVFESPGVAVLIKGNVSGDQLLLSVLQAWPILVFILVSASLAGVVMWLLERRDNADQFPPSFTHGVFEGFWWAFITMTTVGYGDKAPKTVVGKLLGHVWMLAGLIIVTMFISIITSSLASVSLDGRSNLRGVTVSAVNHSEEHKLAIRELARVEALPRSEEVFEFVIDRRVEGALVDVHGLTHHINALAKHNIQVGNILSDHVEYGAILAANSSRLKQCFKEYTAIEEQSLMQLLAENAGTPQEKISIAEDYFGSGGIFSITVYSGLSLFVMLFALGMGWEAYKKSTNKKKQNDQSADKGEREKNQGANTEQHPQAHTNTIVLEDLETHPTTPRLSFAMQHHPTPRLSFGHQPAEQLVSKHSMEVMRMDQEFNSFRRSWEEKRSRILEQYEQERSDGYLNSTNNMFSPRDTSSIE